jgi:hypothetical protein
VVASEAGSVTASVMETVMVSVAASATVPVLESVVA